jgi:hypothetical protein
MYTIRKKKNEKRYETRFSKEINTIIIFFIGQIIKLQLRLFITILIIHNKKYFAES